MALLSPTLIYLSLLSHLSLISGSIESITDFSGPYESITASLYSFQSSLFKSLFSGSFKSLALNISLPENIFTLNILL